MKIASVFSLLLTICYCSAAEPGSQAACVLLHNGHTLRGTVQFQADRCLVDLPSGIQVRLKRGSIAFIGETLLEVYAFQRAAVNPGDVTATLRFADWCLQQGLLKEAGLQLENASSIRQQDPRIQHLQRRLAILSQPPSGRSTLANDPANVVVSSDQVQERMSRLSAETIQQFASLIQPMLLNRCGTNRCHGPAANSKLTLIRTASGRPIPQRLTFRNLYNILDQLESGNPLTSDLLTAPSSPHGNINGGIFSQQDTLQMNRLVKWCELAVQDQPARRIDSISGPTTVLAQPSPARVRTVVPTIDPIRPAPRTPAVPPGFPGGGRDPFDPAPFNELLHPRRLPSVIPGRRS
jgi:hypothetical protein